MGDSWNAWMWRLSSQLKRTYNLLPHIQNGRVVECVHLGVAFLVTAEMQIHSLFHTSRTGDP